MTRVFGLVFAIFLSAPLLGGETNIRPFKDAADERGWLSNMITYHRFTPEEISAASGVTLEKAGELAEQHRGEAKKRRATEPLRVLPYPGGRHPRIGFLEGAIDPQRETKLSIFTPWNERSYVVADVPEAIWSNLGLTYLAHKHIDTIWTKQGIELPKLEWVKLENGDYHCERKLPNGIAFGTLARSTPEAVLMKMWLSNGTSQVLSDLRVQCCVMLKCAEGFNTQTNSNKVAEGMYSACRDESGEKWVITAWKPLHRAWANAPVPCLHSDPRFSELKAGERKDIYGLVSFYEGKEVRDEFRRIEGKWEQWMNF
jgi:hypothetical protein